ncbi:DMT family transporter [Paracoccus aminophilus]|uniref:Small multidrug resistance protein, SMR family n=1 Tax=Paracoccus aminophilus JCM 7686 TaxID=1367847 RepID=S5XN57_PARAH|nr:multidrug efflux SMR transporter [Paracoccus aminophilus]AGT08734.1 small multidrug resistance protein, SMR family [Paracoccus aminophilus JCM 7686]
MLLLAIALEVTGTSLLHATEQFSRLTPTLAMAGCYGLSFYLLSRVLRHIPLGIAYALWSGLGMIMVALVGTFLLGQPLDLAAMVGLAFILVGVVIVNLFSKSSSHETP